MCDMCMYMHPHTVRIELHTWRFGLFFFQTSGCSHGLDMICLPRAQVLERLVQVWCMTIETEEPSRGLLSPK